jgi:2-methylcitrate dehydratase PrpD
MFGTMCKPLHAGKAALNGLTAAVFAGRGFTAHPAVLDVAQGFAATQTTSADPARALEKDADGFDLPDVLFKFHAACYLTHSSIEGLLQLREEHDFGPDDVASVELRVPVGHLSVCNIPAPTTPLEGKFSLRFTSALALARGDLSERAFTPEALAAPDLVALRDRVSVVPEEDRTHVTEVVVRLADGRALTSAVDVFQATPEDQLDREWARLHTKFLSLAGPVLGEDGAAALVQAVLDLPGAASVRPLVSLAVPA